MTQIINVLILDDHPLIADAYKMAINHVSLTDKNLKFNINVAHDCDSALEKINEAKKGLKLDLVLLDISIPPSKNRDLLSGDDVGAKLKKEFKNVKIIVITSHNNNYKLCNIFKSLNPDGFLVKTDISIQELVTAITNVLNDTPYYSKTVTRLIRSHMSSQIVIDKRDRMILYHLSQGAKMKDLPEIVHLSIAGIEKRKRQLRDVFNTPQKDDKALIDRAKESGFI
ncbi:response regulator [uncultured Algibacter sp.]|uniref:response regulator n=1 Tax=uncultured Algibacter sp. TaxID=298659 RepID=UPI00260B09C8|nr:response regulator [uncultured Algibacter sp.]